MTNWSTKSLVPLILLSTLSLSQAQVDLSKILVGKWEGAIEGAHTWRGGPYRTLIIQSAREEGGALRVEAMYGITGLSVSPVNVTVEGAGGEVILRFLTGANSQVTLTLYKEKHLEGSFRLTGAGVGRRDYSMKLTRAE